jgi:hypothetical protein
MYSLPVRKFGEMARMFSAVTLYPAHIAWSTLRAYSYGRSIFAITFVANERSVARGERNLWTQNIERRN